MIPIAKPIIEKEEEEAVLRTIRSGMLAQGPRVEELEQKFAKYCGVDHAVACANGTLALILALHGLDIKGEVLVPSFTFIATATSVISRGAKPVYVEVDPRTFNMDPKDAADKITNRTTCILPVHLYGQPADMGPLQELAEKHGLKIIEDACQAHGAEYHGKKVGALGDCGCFSFYPTKNMTTGEGGMVTTNNEKLAEKMRIFRQHGMKRQYYHEYEGYNFRMTDIHAAIGIEQLKKLDKFNGMRIKNARYLDKSLKSVVTPFVLPKVKHVYHQYTVKSERRNALAEHLKKNGVGYGVYYPVPIHLQPTIIERCGPQAAMPLTEKLCSEVISLPVHSSLTLNELKTVADVVNSFK